MNTSHILLAACLIFAVAHSALALKEDDCEGMYIGSKRVGPRWPRKYKMFWNRFSLHVNCSLCKNCEEICRLPGRWDEEGLQTDRDSI